MTSQDYDAEWRNYIKTGKALRIAGISKPTLLRWIRTGHLDPAPRRDASNGYYLWTSQDLERLIRLARESPAVARKQKGGL